MKNIFKKAILMVIAGAMCMSIVFTSASAEEGKNININGRETKFVELFSVENGEIYLPLRLAFNDFKDDEYSVVLVPSMTEKNIAISVVKINSETGEMEENRRGIYISWTDRILASEEYKNGRISTYQYINLGGNNKRTTSVTRFIPLSSEIIFKEVDSNGGQRAYMSIEDINEMVQFLVDDENYSIKLQ